MDKSKIIESIARQLIDQGNLEIIKEAFSPNYIAHAGEKKYQGRSFLKKYVREIHDSISNLNIIRLEILLESEDRIAWQRSLNGTHQKDFMGIPASNKKVGWYEIVVSRFENGLITEEWLSSDLSAQLMFRLGKK